MAIQTRQGTSGLSGMARVVAVTAGTVAVGAALLAGGLGWRQAATPTEVAAPAQPVVLRSAPLGVDAPAGVDVEALPQGYRDYIRSTIPAQLQASTPLGIDAPAGVDLGTLPTGFTDYVRGDR